MLGTVPYGSTAAAAGRQSSRKRLMPRLGALRQAWTDLESTLPLGWPVSGQYRFGELWTGVAEGSAYRKDRLPIQGR